MTINYTPSNPYSHDVSVALAAALSLITANELIALGTVVYIMLRCYGEFLSIQLKRREIAKGQ